MSPASLGLEFGLNIHFVLWGLRALVWLQSHDRTLYGSLTGGRHYYEDQEKEVDMHCSGVVDIAK